MERKKFSKSIRTYIAHEKNRLRNGFLSSEEIYKKIQELYEGFSKKAKKIEKTILAK